MDWILKYWVEAGFAIILAALTFGYRLLVKKMKESRMEQDAIKNGIQALLRDRIISVHNQFANTGTCPIYAKENVQDMYRAYHALSGNGTITNLVELLMKLPTQSGESGKGTTE